jgi:iron complex outermembrane receptor protein
MRNRQHRRALSSSLIAGALIVASAARAAQPEEGSPSPDAGAPAQGDAGASADDASPGEPVTPAPPERPPAEGPLGAVPVADDIGEISQLPLEALLNQKVETATKTATGVRQIPNRVVVISDDEIRRRGYRYLIELLENLPGVQVMNYVEAETGAHVIVRGIWQNNKILVLYNGHKITSPEGKDFIFGRHNWSLANVKRVELIYGPASALYGADAVSAVINIVPKDFRDLEGHKVEATAGFGIYNTVESDLSTGFAVGPLQVRLDGAFHRSSGPNFLKSYPQYYASLRSEMYRNQMGQVTANGDPVWVAPSLSYHLAALASLGNNTHLHYQRIYSEEQSAMGFRPPLFEFSPENKWAWYQDNVGLTNELHLTDILMLRTLLTYNHQECNPKTQFINSFFDNGLLFTRADYKMFRSIRLGAAEEVVYTGSLGGRRLQAVLGGRFEDIYSLSKISTVTGNPADLRYPLNYQTNDKVPNGEVNFQAMGGYLQVQYDLLSSLNVVAGANVDRVWHYDPSINPRVGVTYSPLETITLRASAAKAYLVPAPAYQFEGFNNKDFPGANTIGAIPNTDLVPEDYLTLEAGAAVVLFQKRLLVDVSAFHTANDNYLLRQRELSGASAMTVPYTPALGEKNALTIQGATAVFTSENGGAVRAYGGEVSLTANVLDSLRPWASYSLVLGSQHESPTRTGAGIDTDYLANQAAHQVKGGLEVRAWRRLYLVPSFVWYGRTKIRPDSRDADVVATGLDPFFLLDGAAIWEGDHLQIWGRVQNVLDKRYMRPGGPVSQQAATQVPQAGVMGQVGIRLLY